MINTMNLTQRWTGLSDYAAKRLILHPKLKFWRKAGSMVFAFSFVSCTAPINATPFVYTVRGNYDEIASCLYRRAEETHTYGRDIHLTRLSNPLEIRVAVSTATSRGGVATLSWEIELQQNDQLTTQLLVRQAGTLLDAQPSWSSFLEPMITRCAGSRPVPA